MSLNISMWAELDMGLVGLGVLCVIRDVLQEIYVDFCLSILIYTFHMHNMLQNLKKMKIVDLIV